MARGFEDVALSLTGAVRIAVYSLAEQLGCTGTLSTDLSFVHGIHGPVLGRFSEGAFILFRDKPYGPRTYELVGCGGYAGSSDGTVTFHGSLP